MPGITAGNWDDNSCSGGGSTGIPLANDNVVICAGNNTTVGWSAATQYGDFTINGTFDMSGTANGIRVNSLTVAGTGSLITSAGDDVISIHGANSSSKAIDIQTGATLTATGGVVTLDPNTGTGPYTVDFSGTANGNELWVLRLGGDNAGGNTPQCNQNATYIQTGKLWLSSHFWHTGEGPRVYYHI